MTIKEINDKEMYALYAPEGTIQLMTLSPDLLTCISMLNLLAGAGLCENAPALNYAGYRVLPVKVTIVESDLTRSFIKAKEPKL